jgi:hypothetical protein
MEPALLNKTKPSSTEEDAFRLNYEEREKVDAIFATYPFAHAEKVRNIEKPLELET